MPKQTLEAACRQLAAMVDKTLPKLIAELEQKVQETAGRAETQEGGQTVPVTDEAFTRHQKAIAAIQANLDALMKLARLAVELSPAAAGTGQEGDDALVAMVERTERRMDRLRRARQKRLAGGAGPAP